MFTLKIDTRNAAFEDGAGELLRLLDEVRAYLASGTKDRALYDINGNKCGQFRLTGMEL